MTRLAIDVRVHSQERKLRALMLLRHPRAVCPALHGVALFTAIRELSTMNIIVARKALSLGSFKGEIGMTGQARNTDMPSNQWELCRIVDECEWNLECLPVCGCVTRLTVNVQLTVRTFCILSQPQKGRDKSASPEQCQGQQKRA
jgi:hypothetical protein